MQLAEPPQQDLRLIMVVIAIENMRMYGVRMNKYEPKYCQDIVVLELGHSNRMLLGERLFSVPRGSFL